MKVSIFILFLISWQFFNVDAKAQNLVFVAKVPFIDSSNLDWEKAIILRGDHSNLEIFKFKDALIPKEKRPSVLKWENSFLLLIEFRGRDKEVFTFDSFTCVYVAGEKISFDLGGENKTYPNLKKLLELNPDRNQPKHP
jgi:hypothetical protein